MKDTYLRFRCSNRTKNLVEQKAKENNLSITAYLESLIMEDINDMMVVINFEITDELYNRMENEPTCYKSTGTTDNVANFFLFTDMEVYDVIRKEFKFEENNINSYTIEEWLEIVLEEKTIDFMGKSYNYSDSIENVMEIIDSQGIAEQDYKKWDQILLDYVKVSAVTEIAADLEDNLNKLSDSEFDMKIIKQGIDRVYNR